jgi:hypothetical protein
MVRAPCVKCTILSCHVFKQRQSGAENTTNGNNNRGKRFPGFNAKQIRHSLCFLPFAIRVSLPLINAGKLFAQP